MSATMRGFTIRMLRLRGAHPRTFVGAKACRDLIRRAGSRLGLTMPPPVESPELTQIRRIMAASGTLVRSRGHQRTNGPSVLVMSTRGGWTTHVAYESVIGWALRLRGARCTFWHCSGGVPICDFTSFRGRPAMPCPSCMPYAQDTFRLFQHSLTTLEEYVSDTRIRQLTANVPSGSFEELLAFEHHGLPVGRMAQISTRWFLNRGTISNDPAVLSTYARFVALGAAMVEASERLLDDVRPDVVMLLNGLFLVEQVVSEVARRRGIRTVTYERGFIHETLRFAHSQPAARYEIDDLWLATKDRGLTAEQARQLDTYLLDRRVSKRSLVDYWPSVVTDRARMAAELGLDPSRLVVTLFTNILWDSAVQERDVAFNGMFDWLHRTVELLGGNEDVQLVIRIHPAEVRLHGQETVERVAERLAETFGTLPPSVTLVPPESPLSSYTLLEDSDAVLVYTSTIGLEGALLGKPVLVAGETHYRGKGFTLDVESPEQYATWLRDPRSVLDQAPISQVELARRYAYSFFFRSMLPFRFVLEPERARPTYAFTGLRQLMPGSDKALDLICDGILDGTPFFLP